MRSKQANIRRIIFGRWIKRAKFYNNGGSNRGLLDARIQIKLIKWPYKLGNVRGCGSGSVLIKGPVHYKRGGNLLNNNPEITHINLH